MSLILSGTDGLSDVDGTAATPAIRGTDANTGIFFGTDIIGFSEGGAEAMRIDSSGNVGIGTTSPSSKLHVVSSSGENKIISEATAASQQASLSLIVQAATPGQTVIYMGKTGATTNGQLGYDPNINAMTMYTNNAERMRIDSSGNLLVGTTTNPGGSARLGIKGSGTTISTVSFYIINSSSVGNFLVYDDGSINTGTTSAGSPYVNTTATGANAVFAANGFMQRSTSSLKYKTDIQDATHGLTDLLKLRSVTYKGKNDGDIIFGGLIAEEVDAAGLNEFVQYAADGSPDALNYGNMVSLCVKAIQEQQALITALTARITALETP
jgi:hypothetical protein